MKQTNRIDRRRKTSVVQIGTTPMGGSNPIRIQSMANVSTMDTEAAVEQAIRMIDAGAEYIRFAAQNEREAQNLGVIRQQLREKGYHTPLVADVHFNPKVADVAARHVEKVRINPGNYTRSFPQKQSKKHDSIEENYAAEVQKIRQRLIPFLELCRSHRTAIRIGVNHGSLSRRIMHRYGDTPEGMVESCMEFLRICKETCFDDVVISLKASNTVTMVQTVRLLVETMQTEGMSFPLHLGVTEAGDDEDGRIKSAVGIGALLIDGIGDTIRVSLSEAPEAELPVARQIIDYILERATLAYPVRPPLGEGTEGVSAIIQPCKGSAFNHLNTALPRHPIVISDRCNGDFTVDANNPPDFIYVNATNHGLPNMTIPLLIDSANWQNRPQTYPYFDAADLNKLKTNEADLKFLELTCTEPDDALLEILRNDPAIAIVLKYESLYSIYQTRSFVRRMKEAGCKTPIILRCDYRETDRESLQIKAAIDFGTLLLDGIGNGLFLCNEKPEPCMTDRTMFGILQATRARISKTEYISCPGCGRTQYDLQTTIARVKAATSHLKGLKIGIMGCIVNGPGEMADADYGYVGAGRGRINLYKGKDCVQKNIPEAEAVEQLVMLIKEVGRDEN